jgi:hypothetical protein
MATNKMTNLHVASHNITENIQMNQLHSPSDRQPHGIEERIDFLAVALESLGIKFSDIEKVLLIQGE